MTFTVPGLPVNSLLSYIRAGFLPAPLLTASKSGVPAGSVPHPMISAGVLHSSGLPALTEHFIAILSFFMVGIVAAARYPNSGSPVKRNDHPFTFPAVAR